MNNNIKQYAPRILMLAIAAGMSMTVSAARQDCWMTGGGSIFDTSGNQAAYDGRTTHGFEIHCDTRNPNNLQINWAGNRFHMTSLDSAMCPDTDGIEPNPPAATFDTFIGIGTGKLNGVPGATVYFRFTDAGEPGVNDTAEITIYDGPTQVLYISGEVDSGNHQAHSN